MFIDPNWPYWQNVNPNNFMKDDQRWNILILKLQYFSADIKNSVKSFLLQRRKFFEENKPPRAQIFGYFRIESRNNETARIRAKPWLFRLPFKLYGIYISNFDIMFDDICYHLSCESFILSSLLAQDCTEKQNFRQLFVIPLDINSSLLCFLSSFWC